MSQSVSISNLPLTCNSYNVSALFGDIGLIKRSFLIRNDKREFTGRAQVTYHDAAHAIEAVKKFNNSDYNGNSISVQITEQENHKDKFNVKEKKLSTKRPLEDASEDLTVNRVKKLKETKETVDDEKIESNYHREQIGRVIVRNVPFQSQKDDVANFFEKFGTITEINFPRLNMKAKNNMKGCVFIQYTNLDDAEKAIEGCNKQQFMGREITVAHAVPKGKYQPAGEKAEKKKIKVKQEKDIDVVTVPDDGKPLPPASKEFDSSTDLMDVDAIKEENSDSEQEEKFSPKKVNTSNLLTNVSIKTEGGVKRVDPKDFQHKPVSRDVEEGRTLFVSKLSIDTSAFSVQTVLAKFGEIKYAVLVMDKLTEQSRGTAFVQFKTKEAADECLAASEDPCRQDQLTVDGRVMDVRRAFGRGERTLADQPDLPRGKDRRNLYLAKEGFIREGTQAAVGVSAFDLQLRRSREKVKQQLLANLHMFVSPTRLCVNNLPPSLKDPQLRHIFKKHAPPNARITESRIMRYLGQVDASGAAPSRCYGFVAFSRPEDALAALRTVNNNPTIFTPLRRPIVEFSIENRDVLNKKAKRLQNSREKNPYSKSYKKEKVGDAPASGEATAAGAPKSRPQYAGFNAKKGDLKAGGKIHKHLSAKVRRRDDGKSKAGFKSKGGPKGKAGPKSKGAPKGGAAKGKIPKQKGASFKTKKNVKKYTKA